MQREAEVSDGMPVGSGLSTTFTPMNWFRDLWWRWQSRRYQWRFQCSKAVELNDHDLAYYAAGNGFLPLFARACRAEARRRGLR